MAIEIDINEDSEYTYYVVPSELDRYLTRAQHKILGLIVKFTKKGKQPCTLTTDYLLTKGIEDNSNTSKAIKELCDMGIISKKVEMDRTLGKVVRHFYYHSTVHITIDDSKKKTKKSQNSKTVVKEKIVQKDSERSAESAEYRSAKTADHRSAESADCFSDRSAESAETVPHFYAERSAESADRTLFINRINMEYIDGVGDKPQTTSPSNDKKFEETDEKIFSAENSNQGINDDHSSDSETKFSDEKKSKSLEDLIKSREPYKSTHPDNVAHHDFPRSELLAKEPACMEEVCEYCRKIINESQSQMFDPILAKINPEVLSGKFWRRGNNQEWTKSKGLKITDWRTELLKWIERERTYIAQHPEQFEKKSDESMSPDELDSILNDLSKNKRVDYGA